MDDSSTSSSTEVDVISLPRRKFTPRRNMNLNLPKDLVALKTNGTISCLGLELYINNLLKKYSNEEEQFKKQIDNIFKFYTDLSGKLKGLLDWESIVHGKYDVKSFDYMFLVKS